MTVKRVTITESDSGLRLDRWFRRAYPELSHGHLQKLLRSGQIRIDGCRVKASMRLEAGQDLRIPPLAASGKDMRRDGGGKEGDGRKPFSREELRALEAALLYRDDWLMALNKAPGLAVQGGSGQQRHLDAMLDALRFGSDERPRLVHRLDKDTSGVLLLARSARAARMLTESFRGKTARKVYWALVAGRPEKTRGVIDLPLIKQGDAGREKVGLDAAAGRDATTLYHLVQRHGAVSWLLLMPLTGRTHQLRAHCALLGMPIIGDGKYGGAKAHPARPVLPKRLMLHAREIAIPHPEDGTTLRVSAPLPAHMAEAWKSLGFAEARGEDALHGLLDYAENFA
jgi:23S rRNA pseudouridine955/2504/2580 synthase